MLKAELHAHTSEDPHDFVPYDARTLINRAADRGYNVLAITLHDKQFDVRQVSSHARDRGLVIISAVERTINGKHVLLLNFPREAEDATSFDDVRRLKARSNGLVIAPHPFFPASSCLGRALDRHGDLFDAVELNAFYTRAIDFNRPALKWAKAHGKAVVGNGDIHRLRQLGTTYSLVDAPPDADAICAAIREGRVEVRTQPISFVQAMVHLGDLVLADASRRLRAPGPAQDRSPEWNDV